MIQRGTGLRLSAGEGQRRMALQGRVAACRVVMIREDGEDPFEMPLIENQQLIRAL
jgi:hypothetical protein